MKQGCKMQGIGIRMAAFKPENPNPNPNFSRNIKISETAKGIRIDVHVWANSTREAIDEAFTMYLKARMKATDNKIPLAPVEEIKIPDNEMQKLNKTLKSTISTKNKSRMIRVVLGGNCTSCYGVPTKKVSYDVGDGDGDKFVEYFCSSCFDKHKKDLNKRLEKMNF